MVFGVEIIGVKRLDPLEHSAVAVVEEVGVLVFAMPGIKRMETEHIKGFVGQIIFDDVVDVFVMTPGEMKGIQSATFFVNAVSSLESGVVAIGVVSKKLRENDFVGISAADWKSITDDGPLGFSPQAEDFSEVMDQAGEDEPPWMAIVSDLFGGLQEVFQLGEIGIRIAIIDELVEIFHGFPDAHGSPIETEVFAFFLLDEFKSLEAMVEPVEFTDGRAGIRFVIAELFLFLVGISRLESLCAGLGIAGFQEFFPLFEVGQGFGGISGCFDWIAHMRRSLGKRESFGNGVDKWRTAIIIFANGRCFKRSIPSEKCFSV